MGRVCHGPSLLWAEMSRNQLILFYMSSNSANNNINNVYNLNLNSLLVKRQIDNPSPGAVTGGN